MRDSCGASSFSKHALHVGEKALDSHHTCVWMKCRRDSSFSLSMPSMRVKSLGFPSYLCLAEVFRWDSYSDTQSSLSMPSPRVRSLGFPSYSFLAEVFMRDSHGDSSSLISVPSMRVKSHSFPSYLCLAEESRRDSRWDPLSSSSMPSNGGEWWYEGRLVLRLSLFIEYALNEGEWWSQGLHHHTFVWPKCPGETRIETLHLHWVCPQMRVSDGPKDCIIILLFVRTCEKTRIETIHSHLSGLVFPPWFNESCEGKF